MSEENYTGLYRYRKTRLIGGIFAGISHKTGLNLWGLRIVFVVLILLLDFHRAFAMLIIGQPELALVYAFLGMGWATGLGLVVYVILWIVIPLKGPTKPQPDWAKP